MKSMHPPARERRPECRVLLALLLLLPSLRIPLHGQPATIAAGRSSLKNGVVFTQGAHGPLLADLYLPQAKGPHPAVLLLHGGAWKHGDRTQLQDIARALADAGYVGMAIDYDTTANGDRFPLALHQSQQALRWLRRHAATYAVDPRRIAVAGSSAGGELAALMALASRPGAGDEVQAAVVFNGVLDLSFVGPDAEDMVAPYLGGPCKDRPEPCRQASPTAMVHPGAPPFFVGHGTADRIVPFAQAERFVALLRENRVPVTPFVADHAGHTYWKDDRWFQPNLAAVLAFLQSAMPAPARGSGRRSPDPGTDAPPTCNPNDPATDAFGVPAVRSRIPCVPGSPPKSQLDN